MLDIALKEPLALFGLRRFGQRHHAGIAGIEMFHEALDGAALAGGVAALHQDHEFLPAVLRPDLQLEKLGLQLRLFALIGRAAQRAGIRILPGLKGLADGILAHSRKATRAGKGFLCPECGGGGGGFRRGRVDEGGLGFHAAAPLCWLNGLAGGVASGNRVFWR